MANSVAVVQVALQRLGSLEINRLLIDGNTAISVLEYIASHVGRFGCCAYSLARCASLSRSFKFGFGSGGSEYGLATQRCGDGMVIRSLTVGQIEILHKHCGI